MRTTSPDRASEGAAQHRICELLAILADPDDGLPALRRSMELLTSGFASFAAVFGASEDGVIPVLAAAHREPSRRDACVELCHGSGELDGVAARVLRTGRPVLGPRMGDGFAVPPPPLQEEGRPAVDPHGLIALPLAARGEALGVLALARTRSDPPFDADDVAFAERIARPLALVADHARLRATVESLRAEAAERTRAEDALRSSEAKFAGIVSLATEAIVSIDAELRITFFNHGAEQVFGYAADEVIGQGLEILIPGRFRDMHASAIRTFAASGVPARRMAERGRIAGLRKNGEEFPAEASISHLEIDGETVLNVVLRDVTERRRVEEELARTVAHAEELRVEAEAAEDRARFLAEAGVELSRSLDYEATLAAVARLAVPHLADYSVTRLRDEDGSPRVVGVAHADPRREPIVRELVGRLPRGSRATAAVDRVIETGTAELVEHITAADRALLAPEPPERDLLETLAPRSYVMAPLRARGRVLGTIALLFAESGRSYTTQDLPVIQALADRAGLAVDNARLYATAREATRARDETLRVVAHDIGNGLSAVRLHASLCTRLLPEDEAGAAAREHARHIAELVSQAQRLRQDLLDAASLESGALTMRFAPVDTVEMVEEALERIAPLAAEKGITVTSEVADDLPVIAADMERLLQAMGNLLGNAVKFTPSGGSVTVRAERVGGAVRVAVTDTGPGIAPEHLPHVFDRFWRAPGAGGVGSGLGLAIAKGLVEAHHGVLEVESEPGAGTTFRFTLPVRPTEP